MVTNDEVVTLKERVDAKLRELNKETLIPLQDCLRVLGEIAEDDSGKKIDRGTGEPLTASRITKIYDSVVVRLTPILA